MTVFELSDVIKAIPSESLTFRRDGHPPARSEVVKGVMGFDDVVTDSRANCHNKLFFALKGENHDGHKFLDKALDAGATGFVLSESTRESSLGLLQNFLAGAPRVSAGPFQSELTVLFVKDTLTALQQLARFWRKKLSPKVIGITGSNGKTTTKEFTATLLSEVFQVHYSKGSFNNHFGVPLSVLGLRKKHQILVQEMGMNHPGEISELVGIVDPDIVCVTNVGRAHLEFLGSIEGVAKAKEEIYSASRVTASRVYNLDNEFTRAMKARAPTEGRIFTFSSEVAESDILFKEKFSTLDFLTIVGRVGDEPGEAKLNIFGRQNVHNLMAAATLAFASGMDGATIWAGLPKCKTVWGRNQLVLLSSGAKALFDAYNANPDSMQMLLQNVSRLNISGRKYAVIGEMLEMGDHSTKAHEHLGSMISALEFEWVWFIGNQGDAVSKGMAGSSKKLVISKSYDESVADQLASVLHVNDLVLLKGSRGMKLERVLERLRPLDPPKKES